MKRYLLDTNTLLDLFLNRHPWAADMAHHQGRSDCIVAAFALPTIFYVARRHAGLPAAQIVLQACSSTLDIAPTHRATLIAAQAFPGSDFEDNLQIASAVAACADAIVTRDPNGFTASPVPVCTPAELASLLSVPKTP